MRLGIAGLTLASCFLIGGLSGCDSNPTGPAAPSGGTSVTAGEGGAAAPADSTTPGPKKKRGVAGAQPVGAQ